MTGTNQDRYPPDDDVWVRLIAAHAMRDPALRAALDTTPAIRTAAAVRLALEKMERDPATQPRLYDTTGSDVTDQFTWTRNPVGTGWIATATATTEVDGRILNPGDLYGPVHAWERR